MDDLTEAARSLCSARPLLTRSELARQLGISQPTLAGRLDGRTGWTFSEAIVISRLSGIDLDQLAKDVAGGGAGDELQ